MPIFQNLEPFCTRGSGSESESVQNFDPDPATQRIQIQYESGSETLASGLANWLPLKMTNTTMQSNTYVKTSCQPIIFHSNQ